MAKSLSGFKSSGTITVTDFRQSPGEYFLATSRARQSFLITQNGKPVAKLVPVEDTTIVQSDGTMIGDPPVTKGNNDLF